MSNSEEETKLTNEKEGWIVVNRTPTHVRTWGGWIEDKIKSDAVIVCVTGNPGIIGFYTVFLTELHRLTSYPVWVINHAGLEYPPDTEGMAVTPWQEDPHLYDLAGQIRHKLEFIRKYTDQGVRLYLIGHSAGAKMVTGLLKEDRTIIPRVSQAYFLFPTLEYIGKSPFGRLHINYGKHFRRFAIFFSWVLYMLPRFMKRWVVSKYLLLRRGAEPVISVVEAALDLLKPRAVSTALFLAKDEMIKIDEPDLEVLEELGDRVNCYYGEKDGWAPKWQAEDVRRLFPKASVTIMDPKYKHAFVLSSPIEVANIVAKHIDKAKKHTSEPHQ